MPTERNLITLSDLVRRAVAIVDPPGEDAAVEEFAVRFEDADQPVRGLLDSLEERVMWGVDEDAPIVMAQAVTIYLAHRLDEFDNTPEHILAHAAQGRVRRQAAREREGLARGPGCEFELTRAMSRNGEERPHSGSAACALVLGSCSLEDPPGGEGRMSIATGGSGGVYQVYGGGVAEMFSANGHPTTAETTSASVDNLFLVADGDSEVAFSLADTAIDAVEGKDSFDGEQLPLRALGTLYSNFTHVVALKSSGITKIEDLKGKQGLDRRAELRHRGDRAAADGGRGPRSRQGRDRSARSAWASPPPRCARARSTRSSGPAACPRARSPTSPPPTTSSCCRWTRTCPSSTSATARRTWRPRWKRASTRTSPAVKTISVPNLLMVREDMDPPLAHDLIKLMFDHKQELAEIHPSAEKLTLEDAQKVVEPVQLHEGAEQYYEEAAVKPVRAPRPDRLGRLWRRPVRGRARR